MAGPSLIPSAFTNADIASHKLTPLGRFRSGSAWCTFCQNREDRPGTELSASVRQGLQRLWELESLCDYTVIAEGRRFKVHKALLAAVSDVFMAMLTVNMRESREDQVDLKAVSAAGMEALLSFVYTGQVELSEENVADVVAAASHLQVTAALTKCTQFLMARVSPSNCIDVLNLVNIYNLSSDLADIARYTIVENFDRIVLDSHHLRLDFKDLRRILQLDTFRYGPELAVFKCIRDWIEHEPTQRTQHITELMECIRLCLIPPADLDAVILPTPFLTDPCKKLIAEAKEYYALPIQDKITCDPNLNKVRNDAVVVTFGGTNNNNDPNNHCFALAETDWVKLPDMEYSFRGASLVTVNNFLIVSGGFVGEYEVSRCCYVFDPRTYTWSNLPEMPTGRVFFPTVHIGDSLYLFGGCEERQQTVPHYINTDKIERYSFSRNQWEQFDVLDAKMRKHDACCLNDSIYVSGGIDEMVMSSNKLRKYEPDTKTWSDCTPMSKVRFSHCMVPLHGRIYIADPINSEIEYYSPSNDQWTSMRITFMQVPDMAEVVHCNEVLYFINGRLEQPDNGQDERDRVCMEVFPIRGRSAPCMEIATYPEEINSPLCCSLVMPWHVMWRARTVSRTPD